MSRTDIMELYRTYPGTPVVECLTRGASENISKSLLRLRRARQHDTLAPPCPPVPGARPAPGQGCGGPASRRMWFPGSHEGACCCRRGMNCCCASAAPKGGLSAARKCVLSAAHKGVLSAAQKCVLSAAHKGGLSAAQKCVLSAASAHLPCQDGGRGPGIDRGVVDKTGCGVRAYLISRC